MIGKNRPKSMVPSGRFLFGRGNRYRDLCHLGRRVVAGDAVDEGDPANRCRPGAIRDSYKAEVPVMVDRPHCDEFYTR